VLTNLGHDRQRFNTLIPTSHESTVVCFVCRSLKAKFHYSTWFGAGSKLVGDQLRTR